MIIHYLEIIVFVKPKFWFLQTISVMKRRSCRRSERLTL